MVYIAHQVSWCYISGILGINKAESETVQNHNIYQINGAHSVTACGPGIHVLRTLHTLHTKSHTSKPMNLTDRIPRVLQVWPKT